MPLSTRPLLVIYVAWHPAFAEGAAIAKMLYEYYRRQLYENVAGGGGLNVVYRSKPEFGSDVPIDIDFHNAETSAVVLLIDAQWVRDAAWVAWGRRLMDRADAAGLGTRVFPVAIDDSVMRLGVTEQALRWDRWAEVERKERERRLVAGLTYQFCRMLRSYLERLNRPREAEDALDQYLRKVQVFLSHSKHDKDKHGEYVARKIRNAIHNGEGLDSFFDVHDIPAGLRFDKVILQRLKVSAVVAVYTDSYSSREWCRREIIEAKRSNVPLVVANCMKDVDERSFPYMGNVPVVRMDPDTADRIDYIITRLLDEVLKDYLWRCRVKLATASKKVQFVPRPPELISLAGVARKRKALLVYPDPPIGIEEQDLFKIVAPWLTLRSMTQWLAEMTV